MNALPVLVAALVAGTSYIGSWALPLPDWAAIAWKGMGVGLLAIWGSLQGTSPDHRLLALVLLLGAIADMVLELNFVAGAAIFAVGHCVAILLYRRNRGPGARRRLLMALPLLLLPGFALPLLPAEWRLPVLAYSLFLVAMAAAAVGSRFPRAAVGALLFLVSDVLIFWRLGPGAGVAGLGVPIWLLYFGGQVLIATGVAQGLRLDLRAARR